MFISYSLFFLSRNPRSSSIKGQSLFFIIKFITYLSKRSDAYCYKKFSKLYCSKLFLSWVHFTFSLPCYNFQLAAPTRLNYYLIAQPEGNYIKLLNCITSIVNVQNSTNYSFPFSPYHKVYITSVQIKVTLHFSAYFHKTMRSI